MTSHCLKFYLVQFQITQNFVYLVVRCCHIWEIMLLISCPQSLRSIFMSYNSMYKGFWCYYHSTACIFVTGHTHFDEIYFSIAAHAPDSVSSSNLDFLSYWELGPHNPTGLSQTHDPPIHHSPNVGPCSCIGLSYDSSTPQRLQQQHTRCHPIWTKLSSTGADNWTSSDSFSPGQLRINIFGTISPGPDSISFNATGSESRIFKPKYPVFLSSKLLVSLG